MPPDTLEFEEPIAVLLKEIEALSMLPSTPERQRSIRQPARASRVDSRRDLQEADAVAARARGAASEPPDHPRLRQPVVHRVHRD